MIIKSIIKDYITENKSNFLMYIVVCSLDNIVKVLVTSRIYSSFLNKNVDLLKAVKNVAYVWILKFILSYSKSYLESIIIPDITFYMRNRLFSDYIKINEKHFNDMDVSTDVRQIIDLTKLLRDLCIWIADSVIPITILMICINGYFLIKYPTVGAVNIIGNIVSLGVINYNYKNILESSLEREELFLKLIEKIDEKLNNMMNIFLNNKTEDAINNGTELEMKYINHYRQQYRDLEWFSTSVKLSNYTFTALCLYILYKCTDTESFINALLIYTFYIQTQETIVEEIPRYMVMISNIKHIEHYLQKKIYDRQDLKTNYPNTMDNFRGNIVIDNVSFKYEKIDTSYNSKKDDSKDVDNSSDTGNETNETNETNTSNVINNLNLNIKAGERIAIYAKSGSGKSTLMKLLLGFYKPQSGTILFDGVDMTTINPSIIRDKINYINQRTLLFQDTIINNMKYGNSKSDKEIIDFLKKYELLYIFRDCDKSENTCLNNVIQNNGLNMSLGMQKIIFLVRGILRSSDVYIFDEPLTSLDPKTRDNIIKMIDQETKGKTVIIVTHDNEINKIVDRKVNLLEIQKSVQ